ncbi:hypothetical protein ACVWYZ_001149 [Thermostichus sp. MS-CIW-37]
MPILLQLLKKALYWVPLSVNMPVVILHHPPLLPRRNYHPTLPYPLRKSMGILSSIPYHFRVFFLPAVSTSTPAQGLLPFGCTGVSTNDG